MLALLRQFLSTSANATVRKRSGNDGPRTRRSIRVESHAERTHFGSKGAAATDAFPFECWRVTGRTARDLAGTAPTASIAWLTSTAMGGATASLDAALAVAAAHAGRAAATGR